MFTEYMLCLINKKIQNSDIYQYLINKFENKLLNEINKEDLLKITFELIYSKNEFDIYMTDNSKLIDLIKKLEINHIRAFNDFNFIYINNNFKKYLSFNYGYIDDINNYLYSILIKCNSYTFERYYNSLELNDTILSSYNRFGFVLITVDVNQYYKDLISSGLNINELSKYFIKNMKEIVYYNEPEKIKIDDEILSEDEEN